jgi:hypothetical protein
MYLISPQHTIQAWTYRENSIIGKPYIAKSDTAKIYSITVTNSLDGGAVACTKCPKGMVNDR